MKTRRVGCFEAGRLVGLDPGSRVGECSLRYELLVLRISKILSLPRHPERSEKYYPFEMSSFAVAVMESPTTIYPRQ